MAADEAFYDFAEAYVQHNYWKRYGGLVRRLTRNLDAEDLIGPAMMGAIRAIRDFDPARTHQRLTGYMSYRMYLECRQEVKSNYVAGLEDSSRSSRARDVPHVSFEALLHENADRSGMDAFDRAELRALFSALPSPFREVLELSILEGLPYDQIALRLNPAKPANRSTISRHRALAAKLLKQQLHGDLL